MPSKKPRIESDDFLDSIHVDEESALCGGIVTAGGSLVTTSGDLRERNRAGNGRGTARSVEDDDKSVENVSGRSTLTSRQSLLDLVSSKFMGRHTPTHHYYHHHQQQQRYFSSSRDSLQGAYVNQGVSELDLSRKGKRKDQPRGKFKLSNAVTTSSRATTPSHLHTPASINHLSASSACNGTETRYTLQQQQQQRGSRGYPGLSSQRGFRTGAPNWSFVFDPAGRLCYYWSMVVSLAFLYNFWVIIYRFAFQEINGETIVVWFCLDYLSDFLYLVDIAFHFRTGYLEDGVLQTDSTKLRTHYMNSTTFYIDCLCLLPLDCLYLSIGFNSILRSFRLVKIYRFWAFMDRTERHTNYPNLFRSTALIHYLLVIFHWNGCLFHIIYKNNGFGSKNWVFSDSETADVVKQYLQSYYWCTLALTTIGDLPRPRSKGEYLFVIVQLLFGLLLFATVLGHVANIVTSVSAARKEFQGGCPGSEFTAKGGPCCSVVYPERPKPVVPPPAEEVSGACKERQKSDPSNRPKKDAASGRPSKPENGILKKPDAAPSRPPTDPARNKRLATALFTLGAIVAVTGLYAFIVHRLSSPPCVDSSSFARA